MRSDIEMGSDDSKASFIPRAVVGYEQLPSQERFHKGRARFRGFSGPIGSGKSRALCQEAINCCLENEGRLGLLGAPTYAMLRDATQKTMLEILEETGIQFQFNKSQNLLTLCGPGSNILLRSMDDCERLRGTNLAWFGLDELTYTHEEAWLRLEGRLRDPQAKRLSGFAVWTPKGFDWVYRKFIKDETRSYDVVVAAPFENKHLLTAVPDFYDRLRSSYDEQFFQQEVMGAYLGSGGGRVYRSFVHEEHLTPTELDPSLPLLWGLDFNVDPMSSVVVQMRGSVATVVDEIVISRATTYMACEEFFGRYGDHEGGIRIYGDASGNNTHTTGSPDYEVIRDFFRGRAKKQPEQRVPRSNPPVRDRISLVNARLKNADGKVSLLLNPRCKGLIADFEELSFQEGTSVPDKSKDSKRSHLSDALGYVLWQECHAGPAGLQPGRIV